MSKKSKAVKTKQEISKPIRERDYSLDLIRIIATWSVISIHFLMNTSFYTEPTASDGMYAMTVLRTFMGICVPLFIVLTGYLMRKKEFSKKYYGGIKKTLFIYLMACIVTLIFKHIKFGEEYDFKSVLLGILGFDAAYYSWYIEMYIGLFLIIPFLNLSYNGLKDKKQKLALVLTLMSMTILPTIINVYNFDIPNWWDMPAQSKEYSAIIPDWWTAMYPLAYYFLGCYLSEFKPKMNKFLNILLLGTAGMIFAAYNFYRSTGTVFVKGVWNDWNSVQDYVLTLLVFIFLSGISFGKAPEFLKKILKSVSDLCLGIYLTSGIFDKLVYEKVIAENPNIPDRFSYYFKTVPLVFVGGMAASALINLMYMLIMKISSKVKKSKA